MTTSALNARAKLFVPGVGIVTPERGGARAREGAARNPFEDDSDGDEVNPLHGESPAKAAQPWYAGL